MYEIEKYYVWKDNDHVDADGFYDYNEAYECAMRVNADEIEKTCWKTEEDYDNGNPADYFEVVWRR